MKNSYQLYIVFQVLKVLLIKSSFLSCCLTWVFTSADIIFYNLFLTSFNIVWKKIFVTNFPFLTDSPKLPTPLFLDSQNLLSMTKIFCLYSLTVFVRHHCQILFLPRSLIRKKMIELLSFAILAARFCLQSFKTNNFKLII